MDEGTEILIRELSEKLGTTAEHLWGVMITQAPIYAFTNTFIIITLIVVTGFVYKKLPKFDTDGDGVLAIQWIFFSFLVFGTFITIVELGPEIITGFLNPQFWALKQLLP